MCFSPSRLFASDWFVAAIVCVISYQANANDIVSLMSSYNLARPVLDDQSQGNRFYLTADIDGDRQVGEVAVYFDKPILEISSSLKNIENWCKILILHLNTKACTFNHNAENNQTLTVYMGRKFYQAPEDAFVLNYAFETTQQDNYFSALITADKGPLGTSDYRINLEFTGIDGKTFGRIQVSQKQSWVSSRASKLYLATLGQGKQGISIVGQNADGSFVHSAGERAVIERNILRYYFAFAAFFNSDSEREHQALNERMNYWFDQTEQYAQLYEVDRENYLEDKQKEYNNQVALQRLENTAP